MSLCLCFWTMREKITFLSVSWARIQPLRNKGDVESVLQWSFGEFTGLATFLSIGESWCSCLALLPSSLTYLFLGRLLGLSYGAGHVCSWGWRPCNANPPPQLRKVPCLPVQNENNKELSVAAASGVQCTHQNVSKSHSLLLPPTHLSMHDSPSLSCFLSLTLFSTYERHAWLQTTM